MIVYTVVQYDYEGAFVDSTWSTRNLAKKRLDILRHIHKDYEIEAILVDEERTERKGYRVRVDVNTGKLFEEPQKTLLGGAHALTPAYTILTFWEKTVYKTKEGEYRAKGFKGMLFKVDVPVTKCGYGNTVGLAMKEAIDNAKKWIATQK